MTVYRVYRRIYVIGGRELTHPLDSNIYLVRLNEKAILVDAGTGKGWEATLRNILEVGVEPRLVSRIMITHCHVNNAGGAERLRRITGGVVVAHEPDATIIRRGDQNATLASEYGLKFQPAVIGFSLRRSESSENLSNVEVLYMHTPGHTPGSMSILVEAGDVKALFIGDLFGPLSKKWGSSIDAWKRSMETIYELDFDLMCSGARCVSASEGRSFIEKALEAGPIWV